MNANPSRHPSSVGRSSPAASTGFTLTELLVVTIIIVILLSVALPAFNSMIYSSSASVSESLLSVGIKSARDAAQSRSSGEDTAAVFFFEPGGRVSILPYYRVGQVLDETNMRGLGARRQTVLRDVFIPIPGGDAVQLPRYFSVRGMTGSFMLNEDLFERTYSVSERNSPQWVFPETGFYNRLVNNDGDDRQTFMVRFEAGTGRLVVAGGPPAIVVSPRPSAVGRTVADRHRFDRADDNRQVVRNILAAYGNSDPGTANFRTLVQLLGNESGDTVLARSVGQIALYDERRLAGALGIRVDRVTGSVYADDDDPALLSGPNVTSVKISQWIEGDTNFDGRVQSRDDGDEPQARVFVVDQASGVIQEMEVQP